jgi:hydroxylaminobenzene mutase
MNRRLMFHGIALFLLGLLTGLVEQRFANPRMGLSAHLEGLMNGTFLLALGAAWNEARLSARAARAAFVSALYGSYANWAVTTLAAVFGTVSMTPLTGGKNAVQWQEFLVTAGFVSVGIAMLAATVILLYGYRGARQNRQQS